MADMALSDVRVIELGGYVTAPYCGKMLADYGAEVIKVEEPGQGDEARRMGPFPGDVPDPEKSGLFLHLNTNKKGITLDITTGSGKKILKELVKEADVLVENFPPGRMASLGLGYEDLAKVNPNLVMTSITPFGQTGPYRDYSSEEIVSFAMSGYMKWEGWPEREPIRFAGRQSLYFAGSNAAAATVTALTGRWLHGIGGQHVDVSVQESTLLLVNSRTLMWAYARDLGVPRGGAGQGFPHGVYLCQDGSVLVIAIGVRYWPRLVKMLDMPELLDDPRFLTLENRIANEGDLMAIVLPWLLEHTRQEIIEKGQAARVMANPVNSIDQLMDDPQAKARGVFTEVDHPAVGTLPYAGAPFRMPETPWRAGRSPLLGEHNEEVYCGRLGYSRNELVLLRERGIV